MALIKEALAFLGNAVTEPDDIISLIEHALARLDTEHGGGTAADSHEEEESGGKDEEESGLPEFVQKEYEWSVLNSAVSVKVPADWGNNLSDSAITSYSPANGSGAISPLSGMVSSFTGTIPGSQPSNV